ncbi:Hypothetical protein FKW44_019070 [Caligus rogercresseyi]|uniref:Uncharacterized protein n=1 Tax=Caligus rogercresseyi TaxID=217165 RepID=A0A7T8GW19_CALRO|nr:Hypothetical protein FKW44_019070 [Caligus rogercresseyi]
MPSGSDGHYIDPGSKDLSHEKPLDQQDPELHYGQSIRPVSGEAEEEGRFGERGRIREEGKK